MALHAIPAHAQIESATPLYTNGSTIADMGYWTSVCQANGCRPGGTCIAYDQLMPDPYSSPGSGSLWCGAFLTSNNVYTGNGIWRISPVCPTPTVNPAVAYKYNPTSNKCERPLQATCPGVDPLPEITDPIALLYENGTYNNRHPDLAHLNQAARDGLACIKQKVAALNCYMTPRATSGYRPAAYQKHIYDVYYKWQKLKNNNTPGCATVKAAIKKQFEKHGKFKHAPGATSNHSQLDAQGNPSGNAVDIDFVPDNATDKADTIACQCNMYRPMINKPNPKDNDPVHFEPRQFRQCIPTRIPR